MHYYKRVVTSGNMIEVEIYKSIKKRNKLSGGRSVRLSKSSEKQKELNDIRAKKKCRRLIANNFVPGDMYLTLSFFEDQTEEDANREVDNFLRRLKYYRKKHGMSDLKYIGALECGKRGNRWHGHIVINKLSFEVVSALWNKGRLFSESLYADGGFKDLANYIRKDVTGKKRLKQSRNLVPPQEKVEELSRKKIREFETGAVPEIPAGYYLADAEYTYNDLTGTAATYTLLPIVYIAAAGVKTPKPTRKA